MTNERRVKCVAISRELLEMLLTTGNKQAGVEVIEGLPPGARLRFAQVYPDSFDLGGKRNVEPDLLLLGFTHETFPPVPEAEIAPRMTVTVRNVPPYSGTWGWFTYRLRKLRSLRRSLKARATDGR